MSMVSEPRKTSRALQFILNVLVLHNPDTKTRYFHTPFLKEIFLLKSNTAIGLLNSFND